MALRHKSMDVTDMSYCHIRLCQNTNFADLPWGHDICRSLGYADNKSIFVFAQQSKFAPRKAVKDLE